MFQDAQNLFSDAQALTATAVSTNVIDLGVDRDVGAGEPMAVMITVDVAADFTTGDETYQIDIQTGSTATPTTVIARRIPVVTASNATSDLGLGKKIVIPLPKENARYLRLNYTLGGTTPSVTLTAALVPMNLADSNNTQQYASGFTVS